MQVANVIPPQRAGRIAEIAGAADTTGWCPIDPMTFASKLLTDVHVIGDACLGGGIPKSAAAASAQGKACARAIQKLLSGKPLETPKLTGICYDTVAPGYAFSLIGIYQPKDEIFAEVAGGGVSAVDAPPQARRQEAEDAEDWYRTITGELWPLDASSSLPYLRSRSWQGRLRPEKRWCRILSSATEFRCR